LEASDEDQDDEEEEDQYVYDDDWASDESSPEPEEDDDDSDYMEGSRKKKKGPAKPRKIATSKKRSRAQTPGKTYKLMVTCYLFVLTFSLYRRLSG
jgi:hypothetical protein